jgi:phospholipid/cholesterol/gamma-HCH transport system substrate-binding protein
MRMNRGRMAIEIRRGRGGFIALLLLIATTIAAVFVIGSGLRLNLPGAATYTARVAVDDAKGVVSAKQQVRISGLPVGKITKIELVNGRPVMTITMKGKYGPLYRDARLRLRPKTPLQDLYLNVESRGHKSAGRVDEGDILQADRTQAPVDIGRVLDAFDADTRTRMEQAVDALGRGLPDHGDEFRATLVKLAPFLQSAQRLAAVTAVRRGHTRRLIHNLSLMMEELGRRDRQLRQLARGGGAALGELGASEAALNRLLVELPPTLRQLVPTFRVLRSTADQLDPALDALVPSARAMPAGLTALRNFSVEALPSLRALRRPLPSLTTLLQALRPTSVGLDQAFAKLRPNAPRLDRITAAIVPCEFAVQKFFSNTISLTKFSDARGGIFRGQTVNGSDLNQKASPSCASGGPRK